MGMYAVIRGGGRDSTTSSHSDLPPLTPEHDTTALIDMPGLVYIHSHALIRHISSQQGYCLWTDMHVICM